MPDRPPDIGRHLTPGRAILLAVGAFLLAFLLASYLTGARFAGEVEELKRRGEPVRVSELVPKVPPGQQNAADLYAKAFVITPPDADLYYPFAGSTQWGPQQVVAAAHLVTAHANYYGLLDQALRLQACAFPMDWDAGFAQHPSYLNRMRDAATALATKAQLQTVRGDLEGAGRTCGALLRLSEHERQSPMLYDLIDSTGHHARAVRELSRLLAEGDLSPAACRTLDAQFAKPDWRAALTRTLQAERANGLAELAQIDEGFLLHGQWDWQMKAIPYVGRPWCNVDKAEYLQLIARQIEASRRPWAEGLRVQEAIDAEIGDTSVYRIPITWLVRERFGGVHFRTARAAAQGGAARIALALTIYHHDHGDYPASLAELGARAGWKLPLDPFTQKPYHYRRERKGFTVWSVGPDLTDNHATDYRGSASQANRSGYDFVFRCAR